MTKKKCNNNLEFESAKNNFHARNEFGCAYKRPLGNYNCKNIPIIIK